MKHSFDDLKKIPADVPAARMLSATGLTLSTELDAPAAAPIKDVLEELQAKEAYLDLVVLLSVVLPVRESIWWACLAARDLMGEKLTPSMKAAEAWVFKPDADNKQAATLAAQTAPPNDDTVHVASAAMYGDGVIEVEGVDDTVHAPPAVVPASVIAMNLNSLSVAEHPLDHWVHVLIDRALDIARGGNGHVEVPPYEPPQPPIDDDDDDDDDVDLDIEEEETA